MEIKKFNEISKDELNYIIDIHYNHWIKHNSKIIKQNTIDKFTQIYTQKKFPFGITLIDNEEIIGFCVLKIENLKQYPEIYPWISDVMIIERYRNRKDRK